MKELLTIMPAFVAFISCIVTLYTQNKISIKNREYEEKRLNQQNSLQKEANTKVYKEPFINAAIDLQSRIFNILKLGFFQTYYISGTERQKNYAVNNTVYLLAQLFAWVEAVRCELQFIDLDDDHKTRLLSELQHNIYSTMQSDRFEPALMVFAGEQRALGERMLKTSEKGVRCIGYGEFLSNDLLIKDPFIQILVEDITKLAEGSQKADMRLASLHHALIDVLVFLDPDYIRFPKDKRQKI
ncbi:lysogenic protein [Obesumbacterium proteus]|uniref:lysogenic protein n=1 Tax=Obesumbacterium proteus TaxID=82983 RepID=UPI0024324912|nr:lysogenic protein [Obesumbacterium proteus]